MTKGGKGKGATREPERRVDPTDGKAYTQADFQDCYGGLEEWEKAKRVGKQSGRGDNSPPKQKPQAPEQEEQLRKDPADGRCYTKQDFIDCYGGTVEWGKAEIVKSAPKEERRIDPSDGKTYTKEDFIDCYGGTAEWDKAAPQKQQAKSRSPPPPPKQQEREKQSPPRKGRDNQKRSIPTDEEITALCQARQNARRERDFKKADTLRDELRSHGIRMDDDNRKWTGPGGRSGEWTSGGRGGPKSNQGGHAPPQKSAWTAGIEERKKKTEKDEQLSWTGGNVSGTSIDEVFQVSPNQKNLEDFLRSDDPALTDSVKVSILLALPLEMFWSLLTFSSLAREWASRVMFSLLDGGKPADADGATRFVARLAFHGERVDNKFSIRSYIALFCAPVNSIFSVEGIVKLAAHASHITLLKEAVCCVLIACHSFYFGGLRSKGAFGSYLAGVQKECWDVVYDCCSGGERAWPNDAMAIKQMRKRLVEGVWGVLKIAPFMVRCMLPISDWTKLFAVMYETPCAALLDRTKGKAGADLCTALLDIMRLIILFYPFPVVGEADQDVGFPHLKIEAALMQGMRGFGLISPLRMDRLPSTLGELLKKTYGNEGAESFMMSEVLSLLHNHTEDLRRDRGGSMPESSKQGSYICDLMAVYQLDETLLQDAANMGKLLPEDVDTIATIAEQLMTRSPALKPSAAPTPDSYPPEAEMIQQVAGDAVKSLGHAAKILAFYDNNPERALAEIFDGNLPPHLQEDTTPLAAASPDGSPKHEMHRRSPPRKPVTVVSDPKRFVNFAELKKKQKTAMHEDAAFDDMLRERIIESQKSYEYNDEADDTCDYIPGGALEEEKKRRGMLTHNYEKSSMKKADNELIAPQESFDCPSDEEWGGYGESSDENEEEEEEDTSSGGKGGKGNRGSKGGKGGKGGKDGFPRALSGESTGGFKGKSNKRMATGDDKKRRSILNKNKGRFGNHNRKDAASRKAAKAMV